LSLLSLGAHAFRVKSRAHGGFSPDGAREVAKASPIQRTCKTQKLTILTVRHSIRTLHEFISMLEAHKVTRIVDVRSIPKSRRVPQFNAESLTSELPARGIDDLHLKCLSGRRPTTKNSINTGWRNASFRGYADYMATWEFQQGIERLLKLAAAKRSAIMCAEAVPWRCHRSLIGDALLVRGVQVEDIISVQNLRAHTLTPFAKVHGLEITYPAEGTLELFAQFE
jgi:uncharacterized protein (DUF488 family)